MKQEISLQVSRHLKTSVQTISEARDFSRVVHTSGTPLADAGAGTLAYYEPWGDVVMFYDDFGAAGGLYELGRAVSGEELIESMSGTVEITAGTQDGQEAESGSGTE